MSAGDHVSDRQFESILSPRPFGPQGKYLTRPTNLFDEPVTDHPKWARGVEAVHANSGRRIGAMSWFPPNTDGHRHVQGSPDPTKPAIFKVAVSRNMRRKGVATAMLAHARDIAPGLQHSGSQALTDDGRAWAQSRP